MFNKFYLFFVVLSTVFVLVLAEKYEKQLQSTIPCLADSDCVKDSICIGNDVDHSGVCTCKKEFIPKKNQTYYECLPELRFINESCKEDIQCQVTFTIHSECKQGYCVCKQGSHFYDNRCFETVKLGQICTFQQSCLLKNGQIAGCVDGRCQCGILKHPVSSPDGESCEDNILLGQDCTNDAQCILSNTKCYGTCRCAPGYTTSSDQTTCLKEAENLMDDCLEDSQCETISPYAICEHNKCSCSRMYHTYKGSCYKNVKLNGTCEYLGECLHFPELKNYLECREGVCRCIHKYSEDGKRCVNSAFFIFPQNKFLIFSFTFWIFITIFLSNEF